MPRKDKEVAIRALARRTAVVLALTLPAAGLALAAGLPQASACSLGSHCYAIAYNQHVAANHGVFGELDVTCLYQPDNGNFVNNELWDVDSSSADWVEVGLKSGVDYHGTYRNKDWFWADSRPGSGYSEHDTSVDANLTTEYGAEITFAGTNTWDVYGENTFSEFGTSTGNSYTPVTAEGGTEYTSSSTSGLRDIGSTHVPPGLLRR
jgi:hypothetical protein